ncbi:hypothetical protein BIW11_06815 [Tropilaelaps mercedesae]|uniref:Uncharacterized protein n=1 Tax=Tropilaelaps mercedesae TaxID=418985 RepID=A0A1V9XWT5_9ACAR|nr:hypothetical protein BIW11_06815 [Tropilaelaps mercedesae]
MQLFHSACRCVGEDQTATNDPGLIFPFILCSPDLTSGQHGQWKPPPEFRSRSPASSSNTYIASISFETTSLNAFQKMGISNLLTHFQNGEVYGLWLAEGRFPTCGILSVSVGHRGEFVPMGHDWLFGRLGNRAERNCVNTCSFKARTLFGGFASFVSLTSLSVSPVSTCCRRCSAYSQRQNKCRTLPGAGFSRRKRSLSISNVSSGSDSGFELKLHSESDHEIFV